MENAAMKCVSAQGYHSLTVGRLYYGRLRTDSQIQIVNDVGHVGFYKAKNFDMIHEIAPGSTVYVSARSYGVAMSEKKERVFRDIVRGYYICDDVTTPQPVAWKYAMPVPPVKRYLKPALTIMKLLVESGYQFETTYACKAGSIAFPYEYFQYCGEELTEERAQCGQWDELWIEER